jgi:hypothetical protein
LACFCLGVGAARGAARALSASSASVISAWGKVRPSAAAKASTRSHHAGGARKVRRGEPRLGLVAGMGGCLPHREGAPQRETGALRGLNPSISPAYSKACVSYRAA